MCWAAAIPVALSGVQALSDQHAANQATAAQIKAMRMQSQEQLRQMNIQNADLSLQARSELETLQDDLTAHNMQKVQALGSIRAAVGEGMLEGSSMERVKRISEGDFIREANKLTDNYKRDYAAIFQQQVGLVQTTKSQIDARNRSEPKQRSRLQNILDPLAAVGSTAATAYASGAFSSESTKAPIVAAKGTKTGR